MKLRKIISKPVVTAVVCAYMANIAFAQTPGSGEVNIEIQPLEVAASTVNIATGVMWNTYSNWAVIDGQAVKFTTHQAVQVVNGKIVDLNGNEVNVQAQTLARQIVAEAAKQVAEAAQAAGKAAGTGVAAALNRFFNQGGYKAFEDKYGGWWKPALVVFGVGSAMYLFYNINNTIKGVGVQGAEMGFARVEVDELPDPNAIKLHWQRDTHISEYAPQPTVKASNISNTGHAIGSVDAVERFQGTVQRSGIRYAINEFWGGLGIETDIEGTVYVPNADGTRLDIWVKYIENGRTMWIQAPTIERSTRFFDPTLPKFQHGGSARRGLGEVDDPETGAAESITLMPHDTIKSPSLPIEMYECFKLGVNEFESCMKGIFKPPATQINVNKYGLISPGPSGSYAQGFQDYAYAFDPFGINGVPNPLIFVNLQGSYGSQSNQVFNLGAGLVQVSVGGSPINAPSRPAQFDCSQPNAFLFPECGFKTAGPGVDPSKITYPSDEVIQFARSRANSVTSSSVFGTPSCSTGYRDGYGLQWVINNSGCNINSSVITLTGNTQSWPTAGLSTAGEQAAAKAKLEAQQREIANQPQPDFPNEIPYQVYQQGWSKYAMATGSGYGSGSQNLYTNPSNLFYYSLESNGSVHCSKPGVHNSVVDCNRAVGLTVLDILYDYNVYRGRPTANLLLSELGAATNFFSSNWSSRNDAALLAPPSSSGSAAQNKTDPLDTLAPNGVVSWAISSMSRQCGNVKNVVTPSSYTDDRGHAWTAKCDGVLTDSRTGYKWKMSLPATPTIDAAPTALLQDVLLQNASNGLMITQNGSTGVFQALPGKTSLSPVAQQWRFEYVALGMYKVVQSSTGKVLTPVGGGRAGATLTVAPYSHSNPQLWVVSAVGGDIRNGFYLVHPASGLAVTPDAWSAAQNNRLILWHKGSRPEQVWGAAQPLQLRNRASGLRMGNEALDAAANSVRLSNETTTDSSQWFTRYVPSNPSNDADRGYVVISNPAGQVLAPTGSDDTKRSQAGATLEAQLYVPGAQRQMWKMVPAEGGFKLFNKLSGLVVTPKGWGKNNGTQLVQWLDSNADSQIWQPNKLTSLVNAQSGMAVTQISGVAIVQNTASGTTDQRWTLEAADPGYYRIRNVTTGKVLTPNAWSRDAGTAIINWSQALADTFEDRIQQWALEFDGSSNGYRIVNRETGLAITPDGWSEAGSTRLIAWHVDASQPTQVWQLPSLSDELKALGRDVPPETIEAGWLAVHKGDRASTFTDATGQLWDIEVPANAKTATLSLRDKPGVNFSLNDVSALISNMGSGTTSKFTKIYNETDNSLWIKDPAVSDTGITLRQFILQHPEIQFVTKWVGLGQAVLSTPAAVVPKAPLFKGSTVSAFNGTSFSFKGGNRFAIYGSAGPGLGRFDVYLNGAKLGNSVDTQAKSPNKRYDNIPLFDSGTLPASLREHKVELRNRQGTLIVSQIEVVPFNGQSTGPSPIVSPGSAANPKWGATVNNKQVGGSEGNMTLHVCRVSYSGGVHAGKTWGGYNRCNIGYGGAEVETSGFEYLEASANYSWSKTATTQLVSAGQNSGKEVYVCRAKISNGSVHPGKVWNGNCNIGYGGQELVIADFEYLTGSGQSNPGTNNTVPPAVDPDPVQPVVWGTDVTDRQVGGVQAGNQALFVCRVLNGSDYMAGKTWSSGERCRAGYSGVEMRILNKPNEYLQASPRYKWTKNRTNRLIQAGQQGGKAAYVCRATFPDGTIHPGMAIDGNNNCSIGYGGAQVNKTDFEYLTQ